VVGRWLWVADMVAVPAPPAALNLKGNEASLKMVYISGFGLVLCASLAGLTFGGVKFFAEVDAAQKYFCGPAVILSYR